MPRKQDYYSWQTWEITSSS